MPLLPTRTQYLASLIPVAPCSAASPCPICQEDYDETHPPVLLPSCGHIFGRPCILSWLTEAVNTCPMDRKELFQIQNTVYEDGWSVVPFRNPASVLGGGLHGASSTATRRNAVSADRPRRRRRRSEHLMYQGGEIVAVNDHLTREGCARFVRDLWRISSAFFQQFSNEFGFLDVDDTFLRPLVEDAMPSGMGVPAQAWPVLLGLVRSMLGWQCGGDWRGEGLTQWEVERCVDEVWGVLGTAAEGR